MMKVYDGWGNYVHLLIDEIEPKIESELHTADKTLYFSCFEQSDYLQNEYYVVFENDRYVIKEINVNDNGVDYVCKLDLEELEQNVIPKFTAENVTVTAAASAAISGTGWSVVSSMTKLRSVQQYKKTPRELLMKIKDAFMCEIKFDNINKIVMLEESIGHDKGVYFRSDLNLKSLELTIDSYDFYTRIVPYGKDGLTIESVNDGKNYIDNHQYSNKVKALLWEDSSYEYADELRDDAAAKLADISKPRKSYQCKVFDLAKASTDYTLFSYELGDIVTVYDTDKNIKDYQKIVKMTVYPEDPDRNTIELSNVFLSWDEMQDRLEAAANAWDSITNSDGTVNGIFVHGITNGDGKVEIEVLVNENATVKKTVSDVQDLAIRVGNLEKIIS